MSAHNGCILFGRRVRKEREARGISLRQFSKKLPMNFSNYSKVERGVIKPSRDAVAFICHELDLPLKQWTAMLGMVDLYTETLFKRAYANAPEETTATLEALALAVKPHPQKAE